MKNPSFSGTFYQIFVPSFCDSNGDGIGDLRGIVQRLDYLQELGIEGLWLSPIHPSDSFHKYDVLDYYAVAEEYGTMADLENLIEACHERGIRILLDLVFNCSSWHHPAFQRALADPDSPERRWYWFDDTPEAAEFDRKSRWNNLPSWHEAENGQRYIGIYGAVMPDYNFHDPGIREECKRIARFWLEKGIDGFRLDSAMHLFSCSEVDPGVSYHALNIGWWEEFRRHCRTVSPNCFLVGEVWTESGERALYYRGLDSSFHFYLGNAIEALIRGELSVSVFLRQIQSARLCASLVTEDYTDAPFLSNHDMPRFTETSGFSMEELKLAAAIYLTLEGVPFVYYGEELGLAPYPGDWCPDFAPDDLMSRSRTAFPWESGKCNRRFSAGYRSESLQVQEQNPNSLLWFYRRLIRLRRDCGALRFGTWEAGECAEGILSYSMTQGADKAVLVHNLSDRAVLLPEAGRAPVDLMTGSQPGEEQKENRWILLPKHSMIFYQ